MKVYTKPEEKVVAEKHVTTQEVKSRKVRSATLAEEMSQISDVQAREIYDQIKKIDDANKLLSEKYPFVTKGRRITKVREFLTKRIGQ